MRNAIVATLPAMLLAGVGLGLAAVADAAVSPPVAVWTVAGTAVGTPARTFCWQGPGGPDVPRERLCVDSDAPSCADGSSTRRVRISTMAAARVRVALRFEPKTVAVLLTPDGGRERTIRPPVRRVVTIRLGPGYRGAVAVFAIERGPRRRGDALYGICVTRPAR